MSLSQRTKLMIAAWIGASAIPAGYLISVRGPEAKPLAPSNNYGWAGEEGVRMAAPLVATMPPFETFSAANPSWSDNNRRNVRLWDAVKKINHGRHLVNVRQEVGDCVSWGYRNAVAYLLAVAVARGEASGWQDVYPPYIYGTSRVLVGGGRLSGDGSVGAWASEAVRRYGVLSVEADGVPGYSGRIARQWGARPGPPSEFIEIASKFKVQTVSPIRSAEAARDAICSGYPVPICSRFGSATFRVQDGRRVANGDDSWGHCMCLISYDGSAASGERYFYCLNSWGADKHGTPLQGEPPGGFWITWRQAQSILQAGDSFALSNFRGFPARRINFNLVQGGTDNDGTQVVDCVRTAGDVWGAGDSGYRLASAGDLRSLAARPNGLQPRDRAGDRPRARDGFQPGGAEAGRDRSGREAEADPVFSLRGLQSLCAVRGGDGAQTAVYRVGDQRDLLVRCADDRPGPSAGFGQTVQRRVVSDLDLNRSRSGDFPQDRRLDGSLSTRRFLPPEAAGWISPSDAYFHVDPSRGFADDVAERFLAAVMRAAGEHPVECAGGACLLACISGVANAVVFALLQVIGRGLIRLSRRPQEAARAKRTG